MFHISTNEYICTYNALLLNKLSYLAINGFLENGSKDFVKNLEKSTFGCKSKIQHDCRKCTKQLTDESGPHKSAEQTTGVIPNLIILLEI